MCMFIWWLCELFYSGFLWFDDFIHFSNKRVDFETPQTSVGKKTSTGLWHCCGQFSGLLSHPGSHMSTTCDSMSRWPELLTCLNLFEVKCYMPKLSVTVTSWRFSIDNCFYFTCFCVAGSPFHDALTDKKSDSTWAGYGEVLWKGRILNFKSSNSNFKNASHHWFTLHVFKAQPLVYQHFTDWVTWQEKMTPKWLL